MNNKISPEEFANLCDQVTAEIGVPHITTDDLRLMVISLFQHLLDDPDRVLKVSINNGEQEVTEPIKGFREYVPSSYRKVIIEYQDHSYCKENKKKHNNYFCECLV